MKSLATLSDGEVIPNPRHLKRRLKKLKQLQRVVSRRTKGGKNRKKAVRKLAKLHRQIKHQRSNTLHQVTTRLAKTKSVLVIEDLNVSGMLKNHHFAQAIGDVGFAEFKRQLLYKAAWYGARVILADRWEPSSKRCSGCGWLDEDLTLATRTFHCEQCGLVLDRDLNAAIVRHFGAYQIPTNGGEVESVDLKDTQPTLRGKPKGESSMLGKRISVKVCSVMFRKSCTQGETCIGTPPVV